jgi:hypothetical protein
LWRYACVSTKFAGKNWSPSSKSAGRLPGSRIKSLHAITAQVIQKIASSLARELKELPEKEEQEQMTAAVTRLFHLESPKQALAGTRSENEANERTSE